MADGDTENKYAARLQQARQNQTSTAQEEGADENSLPGSGASSGTKQHKINAIQGLFMILVALIADGLSALLSAFIITAPLNWIVWIYAVLGFYVWLKLLGISWSGTKGKRTLLFFGGASGIEFIPYINALPAWTAFVIGAIINDRIDEATAQIPGGKNFLNASKK